MRATCECRMTMSSCSGCIRTTHGCCCDRCIRCTPRSNAGQRCLPEDLRTHAAYGGDSSWSRAKQSQRLYVTNTQRLAVVVVKERSRSRNCVCKLLLPAAARLARFHLRYLAYLVALRVR